MPCSKHAGVGKRRTERTRGLVCRSVGMLGSSFARRVCAPAHQHRPTTVFPIGRGVNFAVDGSDFLPQWLKYCSGCHRPYIFLEALNELNKMLPVNGVIARKMNALGQFFPQIILIKAEFYYVVRGTLGRWQQKPTTDLALIAPIHAGHWCGQGVCAHKNPPVRCTWPVDWCARAKQHCTNALRRSRNVAGQQPGRMTFAASLRCRSPACMFDHGACDCMTRGPHASPSTCRR